MNGWWRIWVVLSFALGAVVFGIQYTEDRKVTAWHSLTRSQTAPPSQDRWNEIYREARLDDDRLSACEMSTIRMHLQTHLSVTVVCEKRQRQRFQDALALAFVPGLVLGIIWLTVGWIYLGFRPRK